MIVSDMVVVAARRGEGIGRALMQAAMNSRGGTLYLSTHDDTIAFYERFGFAEVPEADLPATVVAFMESSGDLPNTPEHHHHFMRAR